jgi:fructose-1,6-bisphosphatase/inositol monophosphatase family enzyme
VHSSLLEPLRACAREIGEVVRSGRHEGYSGARATQYHLDVAADDVARRVLRGAGFRVVSEESGVSGEGEYTVVVDPIDGSTNCDHGVPFYATSLAVLREGELVAGLVVNQATGTMYEAERGGGARRDGAPIAPSGVTEFSRAVVSFSGLPPRHLGWAQFRSLGAASLEICLVADGSLDAFTVAHHSTLNPWDYLGGLLVVEEAGAVAGDARGESLVTDASVRRSPIVAATPALLTFLQSLGTL